MQQHDSNDLRLILYFSQVYGTEIGKPRFVSSYNRDHGKLDLPKKYVSVDAGEDSITGSTHCEGKLITKIISYPN